MRNATTMLRTLIAVMFATVLSTGSMAFVAVAHEPSGAPNSAPQAESSTPVIAAGDPVPGLEPIEEIRRRLEQLKTIESPSEEDKTRIDRLQQALDALGRAKAHRERAAEFRELTVQLPQRLERAKAPLAPPAEPAADASIEDLEQAMKVAAAEATASRDAIAQTDGAIAQLADRRRVLPDELARARTALTEETQAAEALPPPTTGSPDTTRQLALARVTERQGQVAMLEAELASLDARSQILAAQRAAADARLVTADALATSIRDLLDDRRQARAEAASTSAREQQADTRTATDPRLVEAAARNVDLASRLRELRQQRDSVKPEFARIEADWQRLKRDFDADQERARVAGATGDLSLVLRSQRQALPSPRTLAATTARLQDLRMRADLDRIEWSIELDQTAAIDRALAGVPDQEGLRALLEERREKLLRPLLADIDEFRVDLALIESSAAKLAETASAYRDFIDERILWARSGPGIWQIGRMELPSAMQSLQRHAGGRDAWEPVWKQLNEHPIPAVLGLAVAAALLLTRPLQRRWLKHLTESALRERTDRFLLTLEGLFSTVLLSSAGAIVMVGIGLSLRPNVVTSPLVGALSSTLLTTAPWIAFLMFTIRLSARGGLAADHFGWRKDQLALLHRVATRLLLLTAPILLATVFLSRLAEWDAIKSVDPLLARVNDGGGVRTLASLLFLPLLAALAWAAWRLFRPSSGLLAAHIAQHPGGWVSRLRFIWCAIIVGMPVTAFVLTSLGWWYTAGVLTSKYLWSAILVLVAATLESTLLRALEFAARSFAHRAREQIADAPAAIEGAEVMQKQEARTEVAALSRKTRATIHGVGIVVLFGGLLLIWSDLLPALRLLDGVHAWDGAHGMVTLRDILWAFILACIVGFAAKNLPGAVEVLFLQHTGMSPAGRYATSAVLGYGIVIVGVAKIASTIGLSWQSVQWLVAAIGVGLGFGLQEIVGNFIAGLIVLFEQPVRVGDVVTVGDRTGQVAKIRIRATTIRDADGKDLILPNKHLITERVVNWTLSGAPLRLVLPIGVAYGTDLALAERLLLESARSMPHVLQTPAPTAQLMGFGASSIDFEMRCFVARIEHLSPTRHGLTMRIQANFNDAGVSIAFPQLDVHVDQATIERTMKELIR